ncbi:twin-arginine translocation signal domain-containing protein [Halalkalicoccus sp. GCM10025322]|uniref:twin-arginine translocation signal domain-containing protein n=1 Tax=Halalkalicoccus TaxID=332246 RepID=UPI002F96517D
MDRRQFIALSAAAGSGMGLAGCTAGGESKDTNTLDNSSNETEETDPQEGEEPKPEPEGGDGRPYTHYELDVHDEREVGHPFWVDQDGRIYGRSGPRVLISDDWWETTEVLYSFEEEGTKDEYVQAIIVPDNGRIIAAIGGRGETGGKVELIDEDLSGSETLYQFDYGRVSNSFGHVTYEDIVIIGSYKLSDFEGNRHANEVILSTDGGQTFEQILEPELVTEDAPNLHIHDVEYDPYAERIWVTVGDSGNTQIYWSDDLGNSWETIGERGDPPQPTQVVAFKDCVVFGTDSAPEGIIRWERDDPNDAPADTSELVRPHVAIDLKEYPDEEGIRVFARRRWHVREDDGRELCLMPFGYSSMHSQARESVVLGSVDGKDWYELYRIEDEDVLLTNIMGPLSMDGDRRTLVSDSNQCTPECGYQIDATVPKFWK